MKNFTSRILIAAALAIAPAAAFANTNNTPVASHDHTPVVRSHTPTIHDRSIPVRH